jgi:methylenetetrahydrofolate reductase (NADPH)
MQHSVPASALLSFEFFPPRSPEASVRLATTQRRLAALDPEFFSVTFGAGGSTRELTLETVLAVRDTTGIDSAPHISCIGFALADIRAVLDRYRAAGIRRLVALRGDMPSGTTGFGELRHANELVEVIRREHGDHFKIAVAAYPEVHPQAPSARADLDNFRRKVDAGANSAITQYFYNVDAYERFVETCRRSGIGIDIIPGVMPVINFSNLRRFSEMCGAEIPRWMLKRLQDFGDDRASIQAFGIEVTTRLCERLLAAGVPGLHFYTMNQHEASLAICANLGFPAAT